MSGIIDALELYRADLHTNNGSKCMYDAVHAALAPFRPGVVETYIKDTFLTDRLFLRMRNLPELELVVDLLDRNLTLGNPEQMFMQVAQNIFDQIKAIPRIEPSENCVLGTN